MSPLYFCVDSEDSVKGLQNGFSALLPHWRINFFKNRQDDKKVTGESSVFRPESKMKEINRNIQDGKFEISEEMTISQLENIFSEQFGLYVQVFLNSENLKVGKALDTAGTLKSQNEQKDEIAVKPDEQLLYRDFPYGC